MTAESTVIRAWYMAVGNRPIKDELIFHSDREEVNMPVKPSETSLKAID